MKSTILWCLFWFLFVLQVYFLVALVHALIQRRKAAREVNYWREVLKALKPPEHDSK